MSKKKTTTDAPVDEATVNEVPADAPVNEATVDAPVNEAPVNEAPVTDSTVDEAPVKDAFSPESKQAAAVRNGVEMPTKVAELALWQVFTSLGLENLSRKIKTDDLKKIAKDTGFPIATIKSLLIKYMTYHGVVSWEEVPVVTLPMIGTKERSVIAMYYEQHKLNQRIYAAENKLIEGLDDKVANKTINNLRAIFNGFYNYIDSVIPMDTDTNTDTYKLMLIQAGASDVEEITLPNGHKTWSPIIKP